LDIFFKTRKLAKVFNSERELRKQYGDRMARTIAVRLAVLKHARTLSMVPVTPPDRRHRLAGKRKEQYAVDLVHPHRLVFEPRRGTAGAGNDTDHDTGGVTAVTIVEVIDYH
jgi:proteic killer suppression protein